MGNKYISSVWSFDLSESSSYLTHGLFRWYGKLVPQLVGKIIDLYVGKGDRVLANFAGSGTIPLECMIRNISCSCIDVNPLALLACFVKTKYFVLENIEVFADNLVIEANKRSNPKEYQLYQPEKWFSTGDDSKLLSLREVIGEIDDDNTRNFFLLVLASIVRDCSKIDSRCLNHIIVDNLKATKDVFSSFKSESFRFYKAITELSAYSNNSTPQIMHGDASNLRDFVDHSFNFVFSHPPYLNAISYYNIYRLSNDVLGYEYSKIRDEDFSAKNLKGYLGFISKAFQESYRVLVPSGRLAVVIGDVRYKGEIIPLQVEFVNLLRQNGFHIEDQFIWILNKKAGMSVARRGNHIDHNYIIIARKD